MLKKIAFWFFMIALVVSSVVVEWHLVEARNEHGVSANVEKLLEDAQQTLDELSAAQKAQDNNTHEAKAKALGDLYVLKVKLSKSKDSVKTDAETKAYNEVMRSINNKIMMNANWLKSTYDSLLKGAQVPQKNPSKKDYEDGVAKLEKLLTTIEADEKASLKAAQKAFGDEEMLSPIWKDAAERTMYREHIETLLKNYKSKAGIKDKDTEKDGEKDKGKGKDSEGISGSAQTDSPGETSLGNQGSFASSGGSTSSNSGSSSGASGGSRASGVSSASSSAGSSSGNTSAGTATSNASSSSGGQTQSGSASADTSSSAQDVGGSAGSDSGGSAGSDSGAQTDARSGSAQGPGDGGE